MRYLYALALLAGAGLLLLLNLCGLALSGALREPLEGWEDE